MISEWLISLGPELFAWLASVLPSDPLPEWIVNADSTITGVIEQYGEGLGVWVPWGFAGTIAGLALGIWLIGLGVRAVRAVAGHVPGFGGNG